VRSNPCHFEAIDRYVKLACERKGWSLAYFASLPAREQNEWIDWEVGREMDVLEAIERAHTQNDEGKIYAETVTARLIVELLRKG
jgi:hypothetical protein